MSSSNKSGSKAASATEIIGSYPLRPDNGVVVSIARGKVRDYTDMRAAQLSALLKLTVGEVGNEFRESSCEVQDNVMWLASTLADEMVDLLDLIDADARTGGAA